MLVEIESYMGDCLIFGKRCSENELRQRMKKVLEAAETEEFTAIFCRIYQFDQYPLSEEIEVDFVIDLDTHQVYAPKY